MTTTQGDGFPAQRAPLELSGQYIWPDARHFRNPPQDPVLPVFRRALDGARGLFGVISGLHDAGIDFLEECLANEEALSLRLVVAVWPACPTTSADLRRLIALQERFGERLQTRVQATDSILDHGLTMLCVSGTRPKDAYLILGKMNDLGTHFGGMGEGGVLRADAITVSAFRRRFLWRWSQSAELTTKGAAELPALRLPEGSREAAELWAGYNSVERLAIRTPLLG